MRRNNRRLFRAARGVLRDDAEAEDVVQEAYVRAFQGLAGFRGEAGLSTWLTRIVCNEALGRLRRRRITVGLDLVGAAAQEDGGHASSSSRRHTTQAAPTPKPSPRDASSGGCSKGQSTRYRAASGWCWSRATWTG